MTFNPPYPKPIRVRLLWQGKIEDAFIVGIDLEDMIICETFQGRLVRTLPSFIMRVNNDPGTETKI